MEIHTFFGRIIVAAFVILALLAFSSPSARIEQGQRLFNQSHLGKNKVMGCVLCHSLKADVSTVGPSLSGLRFRAGKTVPNLNAHQYLRQSIVNPDAFIVSGYLPAIMYAHYSSELSAKQIDAIIIFLLNKT